MEREMKPDEYVQQRLDNQIRWYDRKSTTNKSRLMLSRTTEIIAAALIPFLTGYVSVDVPAVLFSVGALGVLIAILASITALCQFQENWIEYRTTAESLKKEKYLFLTNVEPYDSEDDAFATLVQRVETLVSKENTNWAQYMMKPGVREDGS